MKIGLTSIMYNEERFVKPFLKHIPDWVDEKLVLVSTKPWFGQEDRQDSTAEIARQMGATVMEYPWDSEEQQRNTGQNYFEECDWVIILDPDEYLSSKNWEYLREYLEDTEADAAIVDHQRVFWKDKEVFPHTDYQQLIAARPQVRFTDKRVIDRSYDIAPVELLHFSWVRTDEEILSKIKHYAHANDFNTDKWYKDVWLTERDYDLHPTTPETLHGLIDANLPPEIEELNLWPQ